MKHPSKRKFSLLDELVEGILALKQGVAGGEEVETGGTVRNKRQAANQAKILCTRKRIGFALKRSLRNSTVGEIHKTFIQRTLR